MAYNTSYAERLKQLFTTGKKDKPTEPVPVKKFEDTGKNTGAAIRKNQDEKAKALKDAEGYKKGGKVRKTGKALVHKGEVVLNKSQQKKVGKARVTQAIKPKKARKKK